MTETDGSEVPYGWIVSESSNLIYPSNTYLEFLDSDGFIKINRTDKLVTVTPLGKNSLAHDFELLQHATQAFTPGRVEKNMTTSEERTSDNTRYERLEEIGTGGFGTVYLAKQTALNRKVAIKEIREIFNVFAGIQRDDIVTKFEKTIQNQASIDNPNVIDLYDLVLDSEYPYVVMKYAENGNLRRLIQTEKRPPIEIALKYFLQILHAFDSAHSKDIFHGGVKPENIVLDACGNALVTDFGIPMVADIDTSNNQVYVGVGTVAYMSPEQFSHPNKCSKSSDIYSLGILLYEMLTGKVPGRRSPMPSTFHPDIPKRLDDIFDKMSMDAPKDRYPNIEEILRDIYNCDEIMSLLDKRTSFQFLRDPIVNGATAVDGLPPYRPSMSHNSAQPSQTIENTNENQSGNNDHAASSIPDSEPKDSHSSPPSQPVEQSNNSQQSQTVVEVSDPEPQTHTESQPESSIAETRPPSETFAIVDSEADTVDPPAEEPKPQDNELLNKLNRYSGMFDDGDQYDN